MENAIIFYGAGEYAQHHLAELEKNGLIPVCFADKDKSKWGYFLGGYEIISLQKAISSYPDYELYLTIDRKNTDNVALYLKNEGVESNRIKYVDNYLNALLEIEKLNSYFNMQCMDQIRGRMDFYLIALEIRSYYYDSKKYNELDLSGKKIIDYIFSDEFFRNTVAANRVFKPDSHQQEFISQTYPQTFPRGAYPRVNSGEYSVVDLQDGTAYAMLEEHKVFLRGDIESAQKYWINLMSEQLPNHPHCYLDIGGEFDLKNSEIVADIGGAEGFFCIQHLSRIKHAYIFEADGNWFEMLKKTYEPFKDKVTLINGFVGDGYGNISLDEYFKGKEKPTFVKIDVEGMEGSVIRGMSGIIKDSSRLRLAVCTYHRQEDAPYIEWLLGDSFEIGYSNSYFWHMPDPMPPFLRHGVLRATKIVK
jgi:hypothetical protein